MDIPESVRKNIVIDKISDRIELGMTKFSENRNISVMKRWNDTWNKEEEYIPPTLDVPNTKLFVGFKSLDYSINKAVLPDINIMANEGREIVPKSRTICLIGEKGSGKSILSSIIVLDNIVKKFHLPCLIIDPAGEFYMHKYSLRTRYKDSNMQHKLDEYEQKFNVKFDGYSGKVFNIGFDSTFQEEGVDDSLKLTLNDFRELYNFSKIEGIQSLLSILDLGDSHASGYLAGQILENKEISGFGQVIQILRGELNESNKELKQAGTAFRTYLEEAIMLGTLSSSNDSGIDIISELARNDFVAIKGKLKLGEDAKIYNKYLIYIKIYLAKVIVDRTRFIFGNAAEKKISRLNHQLGVVILSDEADSICPENGGGFLKSLVEQLATKYRKIGITLCALSQNASLLDHVLLQQSDSLFLSRLRSQDNIHAVSERGISKQTIQILRHLEVEKENSLLNLVSEWAYISQHNEIVSFFPCPPLSNFKSQ